MFDLMWMNHKEWKTRFIFRFLCFKINVFTSIYAVVVRRGRRFIVSFSDFSSLPFWIVHMNNLNGCWLFINQSFIEFSIIFIRVVYIVLEAQTTRTINLFLHFIFWFNCNPIFNCSHQQHYI